MSGSSDSPREELALCLLFSIVPVNSQATLTEFNISHPTISVDSCPSILPNRASAVLNYTSHVLEWIWELKWFLKRKDSMLSAFIPSPLLFNLNSIILFASVLIPDSLDFRAIKEALSAVKLLYCFGKGQNWICRSNPPQPPPEAETGSAVTAASKVTKKQIAQETSDWRQQWQQDSNLALTPPGWQRLMIHWGLHWEIQRLRLVQTHLTPACYIQYRGRWRDAD